jgi:hypothetical protein
MLTAAINITAVIFSPSHLRPIASHRVLPTNKGRQTRLVNNAFKRNVKVLQIGLTVSYYTPITRKFPLPFKQMFSF